MPNDVKPILARRYAQACLDVFGSRINLDDCYALQSVADFLQQNRRIVFFLGMPLIDTAIKKEAFERIQQAYKAPAWIMTLFTLLLEHKRVSLIALVLVAIVTLYKNAAGIESFTITSAHDLNKSQQHVCERFLSNETNNNIIITYTQDESLIAGIRMQSAVSLWEHSVKKQLRDLHHFFCLGEDSES